MADPQIVERAQAIPGKCIISGDSAGPLLDTGRTIRGYGRVYVSIKQIGSLLRRAGWITEEDSRELVAEVRTLVDENRALSAQAANFGALIDAVKPFVPEPEPRVVERVVKVPTAPTESDVRAYLGANPAEARRLARVEPGSYDEWASLYRPKPTPEAAPAPVEEVAPASSDGGGAPAPDSKVEVLGTVVDLDEVLALGVKDIESFCESLPVEFVAALQEREIYRAAKAGKPPRKTVLALGEDDK